MRLHPFGLLLPAQLVALAALIGLDLEYADQTEQEVDHVLQQFLYSFELVLLLASQYTFLRADGLCNAEESQHLTLQDMVAVLEKSGSFLYVADCFVGLHVYLQSPEKPLKAVGEILKANFEQFDAFFVLICLDIAIDSFSALLILQFLGLH